MPYFLKNILILHGNDCFANYRYHFDFILKHEEGTGSIQLINVSSNKGLNMSDLHQELTACFHYPETYNLEVDSSSLNEILHLFTAEILQGCSCFDVESVLVDYVTSIIEPVGWKAVWNSKQYSDQDFIVEVFNVSLEKLEAGVLIKSVIFEDQNGMILNKLKRTIDVNNLITVPLIELYTISEDDDDELYVKTAIAIENVRFFMTHLSRPWDGEDDDVVYSEKVLKPRLQLYFDMQNNVLPKAMSAKIKCILKQGWIILNELHSLYSEMNVSDSEAEINEDDLLQSMSLRTKLSELQAKMEILENPVIQSFMMKKYVPYKSKKIHQKSCPVNYIVSKEFTYELISNLPVGSSEILEFEHNAETVFELCSDGDKIFLYPGVYQCDTLGWLEGNIYVEGIGPRSDIILEATGNSEVFLNCCTPNLNMKNVTLRSKSGLMSTLVVHHGEIQLNNCVVDSNGASIGILLLGGSQAFVENSTICNSLEDGIQMRSLSCLHLISSNITNCKKNGITIDAEAANSTDSYTEISVVNSFITGNGGHGIFLNNVPMPIISLQRPAGEFSVLNLCHWLKSKLEDSEIDSNSEMGIGFSSLCKINKKGSGDFKKTHSSCPNQEDLNCSAISDFLNDISFTDLNSKMVVLNKASF